jgi:hypothetical protein
MQLLENLTVNLFGKLFTIALIEIILHISWTIEMGTIL